MNEQEVSVVLGIEREDNEIIFSLWNPTQGNFKLERFVFSMSETEKQTKRGDMVVCNDLGMYNGIKIVKNLTIEKMKSDLVKKYYSGKQKVSAQNTKTQNSR